MQLRYEKYVHATDHQQRGGEHSNQSLNKGLSFLNFPRN